MNLSFVRAAVAGAALLLGAYALPAHAAEAAPAMFSGGVLVAPSGMTLYTFDKDTAGSGKSACNGPCATLWPPLMAAASDKPSGDYSVITRDDGSHQWAYKGKPVYTFQNDKAAGQRNGDGFRGIWHVIAQ